MLGAHPLTVRSNRLELLVNGQIIGRATGIIAKSSETDFYLISGMPSLDLVALLFLEYLPMFVSSCFSKV